MVHPRKGRTGAPGEKCLSYACIATRAYYTLQTWAGSIVSVFVLRRSRCAPTRCIRLRTIPFASYRLLHHHFSNLQVVKLDPSNAVVGQQPSIPAGDCFEYFSGTPASSPEAQMWGSLLVGVGAADKGGKHGGYCLAEVPPFKLHVSRGRRAAAGQ